MWLAGTNHLGPHHCLQRATSEESWSQEPHGRTEARKYEEEQRHLDLHLNCTRGLPKIKTEGKHVSWEWNVVIICLPVTVSASAC